MKCTCGYENEPNALYCVGCGKSLTETQSTQSDTSAAPETNTAAPQTATAETTNYQSYTKTEDTTVAYPQASPARDWQYTGQSQTQQPYYYPHYPVYPQRPAPPSPFTLTDVFVILGFVLAILGVFWYAYILLPASIVFSVLGWSRKTNKRTNNLSVAALIVGICAILIKIGTVLYELGLVPEWLSRGIF